MPKLDLRAAIRIKTASGETLAIKGDGFSWQRNPILTVTGGTITKFTRDDIDYTEIMWRTGGGFTLSDDVSVTMALVGGGGCGGRTGGTNTSPGGGGAGQVVSTADILPAGTYTITIGAGGIASGLNLPGGDGSPSTLSRGEIALTADGGGGGGGVADTPNGASGASGGGGGGGGATIVGGGGTGTGGGNGGDGILGTGTSTAGGGGGGSGGDGQHAAAGQGGDGGPGVHLEYTAEQIWVAGGGGGANNGDPGSGGIGGGTAAQTTVYATNGSGTGGARSALAPGNGGNGLFVIVVRSDEVIVQ